MPKNPDYTVDDANTLRAIYDASTLYISTTKDENYTFAIGDAHEAFYHTNATPYAWTIPPNSSVAFANGTTMLLMNFGAGIITLTRGSGVVLYAVNGATPTNADIAIAENEMWYLWRRSSDVWFASKLGFPAESIHLSGANPIVRLEDPGVADYDIRAGNSGNDDVGFFTSGGTKLFAVDSTNAITGSVFLDEDDMSSDSATKVSSQQAIKAFLENHDQVAKVWGRFEQVGTHSFLDSFNTSSISDLGVGTSQIFIDNDMANTNYALIPSKDLLGDSKGGLSFSSIAVGYFVYQSFDNLGSAIDTHDLTFVIFGD